MLDAVVVLSLGPLKGPGEMIFKWQKISWEFIDRSTCDIPVETLHSAVSYIASQVIDFAQIHLEQLQLLDDYRKLWSLPSHSWVEYLRLVSHSEQQLNCTGQDGKYQDFDV